MNGEQNAEKFEPYEENVLTSGDIQLQGWLAALITHLTFPVGFRNFILLLFILFV